MVLLPIVIEGIEIGLHYINAAAELQAQLSMLITAS